MLGLIHFSHPFFSTSWSFFDCCPLFLGLTRNQLPMRSWLWWVSSAVSWRPTWKIVGGCCSAPCSPVPWLRWRGCRIYIYFMIIWLYRQMVTCLCAGKKYSPNMSLCRRTHAPLVHLKSFILCPFLFGMFQATSEKSILNQYVLLFLLFHIVQD